ncbi:MAG: SCO family protein [Sandaracinaceae bacterium]
MTAARWLGRGTAGAVAAASLVLGAACGSSPEPPPAMVALAPFALVDQRGEPFGSEDLRGHPYVVDFIFTSCPDVCPTMSAQLANLDRRLADVEELRFVSITVDPAHDTPEELRAYGQRFGADPARWHLLTGEPDRVEQVIEQTFFSPVGERLDRPDGRYEILHGQRFLLVDGEGSLRGIYDRDRDGLERLEEHVRLLAGAS